MKGISEVLATVLIVVITVAIIGMYFGFARGLFGTVTNAGNTEVGGVTSNLEKSVDIVAASCTNETYQHCKNILRFSVKNTGTKDITSGELTAFVNETTIGDTFGTTDTDIRATNLSTAETKEFIYKGDVDHPTPVIYTLKIDAPAGYVTEDITCPLVNSSVCIGVGPVNPHNQG